MQILIIRDTHNEYRRYSFQAFCYSPAIFIVGLLDEGFAQPRSIKWLEDINDHSEQRTELWFVNKRNNHLVMTFMDEPEEYEIPFSYEQITFIFQEYLKIKNSDYSPQEIIFLIKDGKVQFKTLNQGESGGLGWHEGSIETFGQTRSLGALLRFLTYIKDTEDIVMQIKNSIPLTYGPFKIHLDMKEQIVIDYFFQTLDPNVFWSTTLPIKAFLWTIKTYAKLIQYPFKEILFYRTPEKYGFIRDIVEESIFEIKS